MCQEHNENKKVATHKFLRLSSFCVRVGRHSSSRCVRCFSKQPSHHQIISTLVRVFYLQHRESHGWKEQWPVNFKTRACVRQTRIIFHLRLKVCELRAYYLTQRAFLMMSDSSEPPTTAAQLLLFQYNILPAQNFKLKTSSSWICVLVLREGVFF